MSELRGQRRSTFDDVKHHRDALRQQRDAQRAEWRAHGKRLNDQCVVTRNAANHAKNQLRERNLYQVGDRAPNSAKNSGTTKQEQEGWNKVFGFLRK